MVRRRLSVADPVDMLIDGRNRRAACKIAGVEPATRSLVGDRATACTKAELSAFVISANIHRRHMKKGQRAMAVATIYPEGEKAGRGKKAIQPNSRETLGFDPMLLSRARTVLAFAPGHAPNVLAGTKSLDEAYAEAKQQKESANSDEARILELRERYPDLADKVVEEELSLSRRDRL